MDKFWVKRPKLESLGDNTERPSNKINSNIESASNRGKGRTFQESWKTKYSWIVFEKEKNNVFCSSCRQCAHLNMLKCSKRDNTFISDGFSNWKHALDKFRTHERSECHRESLEKLNIVNNGTNVHSQLSAANKKEMIAAREALKVIFTTLRYLARQGSAIRGHDEDESNFYQLLLTLSEESEPLLKWLNRPEKYKWISPAIQNEILEILALQVLRNILKNIQKFVYFSLIVDETADSSNKEQVSICIRYVDDNLEVEEVFLGFYATESTTSQSLFNLISDTIKRFDLSF